MIHQVIDISLENTVLGPNEDGFQPKLYTYVLDNSPEIDPNRVRPAVVICPGGGYQMTSDREAEAIAVRLNELGFQAFVLRYSVAPAVFPRALAELATAVSLVREHAGEWHVDPDKITVGGFSAGGHLAGSLGVFWNEEFLAKILRGENQRWRPNSLLLSYPVITSGEFAHKGSFVNLLGDQYDALLAKVSLEKQVGEQVPPVFLWHTDEDDAVPVENSLVMAWALKRHHIPMDMHIYAHGVHGLGLATEETKYLSGASVQPECAGWIDLFATWAKSL